MQGDWICILYGCSVSVILRPTPVKPWVGQRVTGRTATATQDPPVRGDYFTLVGESYVHGLMEGSAVECQEYSGSERDFILV